MASEDAVVKSPEIGDDYDDSLLLTPESSASEETPVEPEPTAETPEPVVEAEMPVEPVAEATEETSETETEPTPEAKPAPGTPDKALQKVQQRESAVERKLDALLAVIEKQGQATPEQVAQAQQLQQQHADVKDDLAEILNQKPEDMDFEAAGKGLHVVGKRLKALEEALESERREKQELKKSLSTIQQDRTWSAYESQYPGIDVRSEWQSVYDTTRQRYGHLGEQAVLQFASDRFHEQAASKIQKPQPKAAESTPKPTPKPATTTTHKAAPPTPGGGQVTVKGSQTHKPAATETPEQEYERISKTLLKD
jgi:hypothetical protein